MAGPGTPGPAQVGTVVGWRQGRRSLGAGDGRR